MKGKKIFKWLGAILLILIVVILIFLYSITPLLNGSQQKTRKYFASKNVNYRESKLQWKDRSIHIIQTGNLNSKKMILFIHGAPGSNKDFSDFMVDSSLMKNALLVAYDRPGYGRSNYGRELTSLESQAAIAEAIINKYTVDSVILVGYSYGGPISGVLAASNNPKISSLVMLAPTNSPDAEPFFWFNKLINNKLSSFILPDYIIMANREKYAHPQELLRIKNRWSRITVPVIHFHCYNDWIAPFVENSEFVAEHVNSELLKQVFWEGDNHFLPNTQLSRIRPYLLDLLIVNGIDLGENEVIRQE